MLGLLPETQVDMDPVWSLGRLLPGPRTLGLVDKGPPQGLQLDPQIRLVTRYTDRCGFYESLKEFPGGQNGPWTTAKRG